MVCARCKEAVKAIIERLDMIPASLELGEIELKEQPSKEKIKQLRLALQVAGFELIDDKKSRTIEKIKTLIVELVHYSNEQPKTNLSNYLSDKLHQDYTYLSNLFSETEGITIEKYLIAQKTERVKELLMYDELSLSEIAYKLNYSSAAHLSSQFKKVTGLTPSFYRSLKEKKRIGIEKL